MIERIAMSTTDRSRRLLGSTPLILVAMFAAGAALLTLLYWGLHLNLLKE